MRDSGTDQDLVDFLHGVRPRLSRLALVLSGDNDRAADLVQDTLVKVVRSWDRVRRSDDAVSYACRIMVNHWRDGARRARSLPVDTFVLGPQAHPDEDRVLDRITLREAMVCLTARQRAVLYLRFYEDLSVRETADRMGCSEGTVKSQTHAALRAISSGRSLTPNHP